MSDLPDEELDQLLRRAGDSLLRAINSVIDPEKSLAELRRRVQEEPFTEEEE